MTESKAEAVVKTLLKIVEAKGLQSLLVSKPADADAAQ
jgi:hypothetical protein